MGDSSKVFGFLVGLTVFSGLAGLSGLSGMAAATNTADSGRAATFSKDIAPILQARCEGCHRPGQVGPMPLRTYDEVRPWAKAIERQVLARKMPPWFAHPDSREMKGDLNLSEDEIATIAAWVAQGAPEGEVADLPPERTFTTFEGGWRLKQPDLVLATAAPFAVGAEVDDEYRCFAVPLGVDHDLWLKGAELRPGNHEVVHHLILFGDTTGTAAKLDAATKEPGWECGSMEGSLAQMKILQMWAPGNVTPLMPDGVGRKIPADADLMLQVHYHNVSGVEQVDRSSFGMHLAQPEETIQKEMNAQLVSAWQLHIPAGDANAEHRASYTAPAALTVYSTGVHMHYRGKDMGLWATLPDGVRETLIWVPSYDFNWQLTYEFVEPLRVPAGTVFEMVSHHDNSEHNPFNPAQPPVDVHWGLATSDEMAFAGISYTVDAEQLGITPRLP
jgi:hypothetical protein